MHLRLRNLGIDLGNDPAYLHSETTADTLENPFIIILFSLNIVVRSYSNNMPCNYFCM